MNRPRLDEKYKAAVVIICNIDGDVHRINAMLKSDKDTNKDTETKNKQTLALKR